MEGQLSKNMRVKLREVEEWEDQDLDGWKMWKRICGR
jgi:hypothetical protein